MDPARILALGLVTLFLLGAFINGVEGQIQSIDTDLESLLKIREALIDPQGTLSEWTIGNSWFMCRWRGVYCFNERVSEIRLPGAGLRGHIAGA